MDDTTTSKPFLSPFEGPDWRWERAGQRQSFCGKDETDHWITLARALRLDPKSEPNSPEIRQAIELQHDQQPFRRNEVQALLLTQIPLTDIAERCRLPLKTVEAFSAVFFDVRSRFYARDWIAARVPGCAPWKGFGEMPGGLWRYAAYTGGVDAFEVVFAITTNRPVPERLLPVKPRERRVAEARFRLATELWIALMTARTDATAAAVLKIHRQLRALERKRMNRGSNDDALLDTMERFLLLTGERAFPKRRRGTSRRVTRKSAADKAALRKRGHPFDILRRH